MPIVRVSTTPPAPPISPGIPFPEIGFASATWYAPDGSVWPLTDLSEGRGYFTMAEGVTGLDAAPIEITTDAHPRGGARVRHIQPQPRIITWGLYVFGGTHNDFVTKWRSIMKAFTCTKRLGPGRLEIARPDGTRRQIAAYYQSGFEGQGKQGTGIASDSVVLTLFCEDPYWVDPVPTVIRRAQEGEPEDYFEPFPSIVSGQVLGNTVVNNPGDEVAWPVWTITGPAAGITATNEDTGEEFSLDPSSPVIDHGALQPGEKVTITTDPPTVTFEDGSNWIGGLDWPTAVLWGLEPGDNNVTFSLASADSGSSVELVFNARYESA